jgi:hypothetical protein
VPQKGAQEMLHFVADKYEHMDSTNHLLTHVLGSDFHKKVFSSGWTFSIKKFECEDVIKINIFGVKCV